MIDENIKKLLEAHSDAQQVLEDTAMGFVQETAKHQKYAKNLEVMVSQMLLLMNRHIEVNTKTGIVKVDSHGLSRELSAHALGSKNLQDVIFKAIDIEKAEETK